MIKNRKPLWITLISIDALITIFLFVVSIIMLATMPKTDVDKILLETKGAENFIEYFQLHSTLYLLVGVLPLFLLLILNIVILVFYVKKTTEKKKVALNELSDEQKEALRQELLRDLSDNK